MPIRDLLHRKDKIADAGNYDDDASDIPPLPTFVRSDTHTFEVIKPPSIGNSPIETSDGPSEARPRRLSIFKARSRSNSSASHTSPTTLTSGRSSLDRSPNPKRLSERLHLKRERSSTRVPQDLPDIAAITIGDASGKGEGDTEAQWEDRATKLAQFNERNNAGPSSSQGLQSRPPVRVSSPAGDDNIQEAIRLHEAGDLIRSTSMFGRLADIKGESNALSQVLYGLALR